MADKTGSTVDSSDLHPSYGSMLFVKPVAWRDRPRSVLPIWPWTMNSIKVFIRKLVELLMREGLLFAFEIQSWTKKAEPADRWFLCPKVNVIVINPVKGDSQPILKALKKLESKGIKIIAVDTQLKHFKPDASIVSDNHQAGVLIAKELMRRSSNARILLWSIRDGFQQIREFRDLRIPIRGHGSYQIVSN